MRVGEDKQHLPPAEFFEGEFAAVEAWQAETERQTAGESLTRAPAAVIR